MNKIALTEISESYLLIESKADIGVRMIADTIAEDIQLVVGRKPVCVAELEERAGQAVIFVGTVGKSDLLEQLEREGKINLSRLRGKRECYQYSFVNWKDSTMLVIAGSDKRGTIYGMFSLTQQMGVSPLIYWGDVKPYRCGQVIISDEPMQWSGQESKEIGWVFVEKDWVSKEPSVEYRGFFINDEWPCFGNWTMKHFGGFTAEMYRHVFELLLRLKGNYIWPAMWTSSFALDGPGLANAQLADELGVVVGNSHHEPCLRASEEWDIYKGEDTIYGTEWNYRKNKQGLLNYWRDGLKRSIGFESLITVGMRGERDSAVLGTNNTLKDNIDLLKEIITNQRKLIDTYKKDSNPRLLLALYKEVEAYFYGDERTQGLQDWSELDDVLFMLCEDNFGNMRTLPPRKLRNHRGGWGMYYHFDYHGDPISYEWINSTSLIKVWEQMSMAYDSGIRSAWIVNVGDLKFKEYPLSYFMALAYDYEKWGSGNLNSVREFEEQWAKDTFGRFVDEATWREIGRIQKEYSYLNSLRHPEALNDTIYHHSHYQEAERMLARAERLEQDNRALYERLPEACKAAYYSMIYFQAAATANLLKMHLFAGQNHKYARQGNVIANVYERWMAACIEEDDRLADEMAAFLDGKWDGMQLAYHVGFTHWNDQDYRYPVQMTFRPAKKPRMIVSRADEERSYTNSYWFETLRLEDFSDSIVDSVEIQLGNGGEGTYAFEIVGACPWLHFSQTCGEVRDVLRIRIVMDREKFAKECEENSKTFSYCIKNDQNEKIGLEIVAAKQKLPALSAGTYIEDKGQVVMQADGYCQSRTGIYEENAAQYQRLDGYGKYACAMKVFPSTAIFTDTEKMPSLTYQFYLKAEDDYVIRWTTNPASPVQKEEGARFAWSVDGGAIQICNTVRSDYRAGEGSCKEWAQGVLCQEHKNDSEIHLCAGIHTLKILAVDAIVAIEQISIYHRERPIAEAYLGAFESPRV